MAVCSSSKVFLYEVIPINIIKEVGLILTICLVGEWVAALLPFSFPASVISMILLLTLLWAGVIKERHIQTLSNFLVVNMGLFFIPSLVGTLEHTKTLMTNLIPFLVITLLTTPLVYLAAAWSVQLLTKSLGRKEKGHD